MILIIDNYDSFTYNLYQAVGELYPHVEVIRNDEIKVEDIEKLAPEAIIISPGPGYPDSAGISVEAIRRYSGKYPILGVCLGHQAIVEAFGGNIVQATALMHGKASDIRINTKSEIFRNLPDTIKVARYHSLIAQAKTLPECLEVIGTDINSQIMALEHKEHKTYGLQFHPESILTDTGKTILRNFLNLIDGIELENASDKTIQQKTKKTTVLKPLLAKVVDGNNLTEAEALEAVNCIMSGEATDSQIAGFLTALRIKGETIEEITGFAKGMRAKASAVKGCSDAIDIVGTGGDLANSFNISTTSAFVIAGAGVKVAKHGNRSVSSKSGAADVLESLGVTITTSPEKSQKLIQTIGISFLFAQTFHSSMKFVGTPRREMGIRTIFNILGPLANPASTEYILLGVYDKALLKPMAQVLINLGITRAMLVHGNDGLDEISVSDTTSVAEVNNGKISEYTLNPEDYGIRLAKKSEIIGGTAQENAKITLGILNGEIQDAKRDIVLLNAGCALYTAGRVQTIAEGIVMAKASIDSGRAMIKLNELIKASEG